MMNGIVGVGEPFGTWVELLKVGDKNDILRLGGRRRGGGEMTVVVVLTSKKSISFIK